MRLFNDVRLKSIDLDTVLYFKYYQFSFLCMALVLAFLYYSDGFLKSLIALVIMYVVGKHPFVEFHLERLLNKYGAFHTLNKDYYEPKVYTDSVKSMKKYSQYNPALVEKVRKDEDLNILDLPSKVNKILFKIFIILVEISSFLERVISLHTWEDSRRTGIYLAALVVIACLIEMIETKYWLMMIVLKLFHSGSKKYRKIYEKNKQLVEWTVDYIL